MIQEQEKKQQSKKATHFIDRLLTGIQSKVSSIVNKLSQQDNQFLRQKKSQAMRDIEFLLSKKQYFQNQQDKRQLRKQKIKALHPDSQISSSTTQSILIKQQLKQNVDKKQQYVSGAFTLARNQGAVSIYDSQRINSFYKRVLVSSFLSLGYSAMVLQFLFQSKILTQKNFPFLYFNLQKIWYPVLFTGIIITAHRKHNRLIKLLDVKYTPIWNDITQAYKEKAAKLQMEQQEKQKQLAEQQKKQKKLQDSLQFKQLKK